MFRLAYDLSVLELVKKTQPAAASEDADLAELMFGFVRRRARAERGRAEREDARRGRVAIGDARAQGGTCREVAEPIQAVLSAPKPTCYPSYVVQKKPQPPFRKGEGFQWETYMDQGRPKAAGWKRYLARRKEEKRPHIPPKANDRVTTRFRPLKAGAKFEFPIRVHNLRPVELGALVWALELGGFEDARHALGLGRSLGYGQVRLSLADAHLERNDGDAAPSLGEARLAFERYMESCVRGGWKTSPQIQQLITMARPPLDESEEQYIRHMRLEDGEFTNAKKAGLVLGPHGTEADHERFRAEAKPAEAAADDLGAHLSLAIVRAEGEEEDTDAPGPSPEPEASAPAEAPSTPEPPAPKPQGPLPEVLEVEFADIKSARDARQNAAKRIAKNKAPKPVWMAVRPTDPALRDDPRLQSLQILSTADGMTEVFERLKNAPANVEFRVSLDADSGTLTVDKEGAS
jgi:hypothetical protein